jgi:hypothetical protein
MHSHKNPNGIQFESTDLFLFLKRVAEKSEPPAPYCIVYGNTGLFADINDRMLAWAAINLIQIIGRRTGGVAVSVAPSSKDNATCNFQEAWLLRSKSNTRILRNADEALISLQSSQQTTCPPLHVLAPVERIVSLHGGQVLFNFTGAQGLSAIVNLPINIASAGS